MSEKLGSCNKSTPAAPACRNKSTTKTKAPAATSVDCLCAAPTSQPTTLTYHQQEHGGVGAAAVPSLRRLCGLATTAGGQNATTAAQFCVNGIAVALKHKHTGLGSDTSTTPPLSYCTKAHSCVLSSDLSARRVCVIVLCWYGCWCSLRLMRAMLWQMPCSSCSTPWWQQHYTSCTATAATLRQVTGSRYG